MQSLTVGHRRYRAAPILVLPILALCPHLADAQVAEFEASDSTARLVFSDDGRVLRAVGDEFVTIYDTEAGLAAATHQLGERRQVLSVSLDGSLAVIATAKPDTRNLVASNVDLFILDTDSGRMDPVPTSWYEIDSFSHAALSGDGSTVSIYSESGAGPEPETITLYDWSQRELRATVTSAVIPALDNSGKMISLLDSRTGEPKY